MRLPHSLVHSLFFNFSKLEELLKALDTTVTAEEIEDVIELAGNGLPPVTSRNVLGTIFGINPGLIWSFENKPHHHYRTFQIPKGRTFRRITAPRVGLKVIQTWLATQLQNVFTPADHVYGFVPGRSHVDAASQHCGARWIFSVDIKDFFQSTPERLVENSLIELGFTEKGAKLITHLTCYRQALAQGAPSSPVLSNLCFQEMDGKLLEIAARYSVRLTRYADDIVFSSANDFSEDLKEEVLSLFGETPWTLAEQKIHYSQLPNRLKVHGLLVHGSHVRLTKGYRKRLRAFDHLLKKDRVSEADIAKIKGHLNYADYIIKKTGEN